MIGQKLENMIFFALPGTIIFLTCKTKRMKRIFFECHSFEIGKRAMTVKVFEMIVQSVLRE